MPATGNRMVLGWLRMGDLAESGNDTDRKSVSMVVGEVRQAVEAEDLTIVLLSTSGLMRWIRSRTRLLGDGRHGAHVWCDVGLDAGVIWILGVTEGAGEASFGNASGMVGWIGVRSGRQRSGLVVAGTTGVTSEHFGGSTVLEMVPRSLAAAGDATNGLEMQRGGGVLLLISGGGEDIVCLVDLGATPVEKQLAGIDGVVDSVWAGVGTKFDESVVLLLVAEKKICCLVALVILASVKVVCWEEMTSDICCCNCCCC